MARYKLHTTRIYVEDEVGVKPIAPQNMIPSTISKLTMGRDLPNELMFFLGNADEYSGKAYGKDSLLGNMSLAFTPETLTLALFYVYGNDSMYAVSESWKSGTAYSVGDIVNHPNNTHSLYCLNSGTSDTTIPDITSVDAFDTVTDNTVTWVVRNLLYEYIGTSQSCISTFGIELQFKDALCEDEDIFFRYNGCRFENISLGKMGSDVALSTDIKIGAMSFENSISDTYVAQGGEDTYLTQPVLENCNLSVYVDGNIVHQSTELTMSTDRQATENKSTNLDNIVDYGGILSKGKGSFIFENAIYLRSEKQSKHTIDFVYTDGLGSSSTITFNNVLFDKSSPTIETDRYSMFNCDIMATGSRGSPSVQYSCICDNIGMIPPTPYVVDDIGNFVVDDFGNNIITD